MKSLFTLSLVTLLASAATAFATPIDASMNFSVSLGDPVVSNNFDLVSWSVTPVGLSVAASASLVSSNVYGNGSATWAADGNSGTIQMNFGWDLDGGVKAANTNLAPSNWVYNFTADANGNFVMNYAIGGSGHDLFGLWGFDLFHILDNGVGGPVTDANDPSSSGQFVGAVTAGQNYFVSLYNNGNISSGDVNENLST